MATEIKRMRYFDGLFLKEEEFQLDQEYNLRMRRLHNRYLHGCGIVWGLDVEVGPTANQVTVRQGMAIDKTFDNDNSEEIGREIIVPNDTDLTVVGAANTSVYLYVYYSEQQADVVAELGGTEPIHWLEAATLEFAPDRPADEEENLILARIDIKADGTVDAASIVYEEAGESLRKILEAPTGDTTVIATGGEGKNYVLNKDAETDTADWTDAASGNITVATTDVAGEVLSGATSFTLNANSSVAIDTDYVTVGLAPIDEEDKNQLMAVELSYKGITNWENGHLKVVVRDTTNNVDIPVGPQLVPGGQGKYRGLFSTSSSLTYELRLVANVASQNFTLAVDSVRVGPDRVTIGAAISGWTEYDMVIGASVTPPTKSPTPDFEKALWRRVGDSMEIVYSYRHSSISGTTSGSGVYLFGIPDGYTIDTSKVVTDANDVLGVVGSASVENPGNNSVGMVKVYESTNLAIMPDSSSDTSFAYNYVSDLNFALDNTLAGYSFRATVPIAEWQSDIVLAESRTEYVYNSDDGDQDNLTAFSTGQIGALVPDKVKAAGANLDIRKRIRLSRSFKHVKLEFQMGGAGPFTSSAFYPDHTQDNGLGPNHYAGAHLEAVSGNELEYDVVFNSYSRFLASNSNRGWQDERLENTRWRVVASDNPFFVENDNVAAGDVGPWTSAGEIVWKGTSNNPGTTATTSINQLYYRRVGESMELSGQYVQTAGTTNGNGQFYFEIPEGLRAAARAVTSTANSGNTFGSVSIHEPTYGSFHGGVSLLDNRKIGFWGFFQDGNVNDSAGFFDSGRWDFSTGNELSISFQATIPIDEWTNSDLVLRENRTEYVYNTNEANIAIDDTSFAEGENGALVPSLDQTNRYNGRRVRFSRAFRHVRLEVQTNGGTWNDVGSSYLAYQHYTDDNGRGMFLEQVPNEPLEYIVRFAHMGSHRDQVISHSWALEQAANQTRWRVVGSDNPLFVEAGDVIEAGDVGPWTDAGPIVFGSPNGAAPVPGATIVHNRYHWRRVGESMEFVGQFHMDSPGTNGAGPYVIELPEGLNADSSKVQFGLATLGSTNFGVGSMYAVNGESWTGHIEFYDSRRFTLVGRQTTNTFRTLEDASSNFTAPGLVIAFQGNVPIAEWANSDLVLRENRTEYVFNSATAGAEDLTSFATGEDGVLIQPMPPSVSTKVRVQLSRVFKHVRLEVKPNNSSWVDVSSTPYKHHWDATVGNSGMYLEPVPGNPTQWDVLFSEGGRHEPHVGHNPWTLENTNQTRWRVVGSDNPLFVEAGDVIEAGDVGPWTAYTPELTAGGSGSDPTRAPGFVERAFWRRVGETMEITYSYQTLSGAGTNPASSGLYLWSLPSGLTIDSTRLNITQNFVNNVGSATVSNGAQFTTGYVFAFDTSNLALVSQGSGVSIGVGEGHYPLTTGGVTYAFHAKVPIAEWANSDLVIRENRTEYVFNGNEDDVTDTTSFAIGENGALVPNVTGGATRRVRLSRTFKHVRLEVNIRNGNWADVGATFLGYHVLSGGGRGMQLATVTGSTTEYDIRFMTAGIHEDGLSSHDWATENGLGTRWRVVASDNPLFVESPTQGNLIGQWTDAGEIAFKGTTTDPVAGTTDTNSLRYRRVGESMHIEGIFRQTAGGTQGSGTYLIEIPEGLHISSAVQSTQTPGVTFGTAVIGEDTVDQGAGSVSWWDDRHVTLVTQVLNPSPDLQVFSSTSWDFSTGNNLFISFQATIPIEEWTGVDVVLSESRVEFVSNDDPGNTTNSTAFVTGEDGSLVPNVDTSRKAKRVQFSRVYKHVRLEVQQGGSGAWMAVADSQYSLGADDSGVFGIIMSRVSDLEYDVHFQKSGIYATDGAGNLNSWPNERLNGTRWRVVGADNPFLVQAPGPEFLTSVAALGPGSVPSGTPPTMSGNSVLLSPGSWRLTGDILFHSPLASSGQSNWSYRWSPSNGSTTEIVVEAGSSNASTAHAPTAGVPSYHMTVGAVRITVAVATEVFLNPQVLAATPANAAIDLNIYAERIS